MKFKKTISIILTALMILPQFNAGAMFGGNSSSFDGGFAAFVGSPQSRDDSSEFTPNPSTDPLRAGRDAVVTVNPDAIKKPATQTPATQKSATQKSATQVPTATPTPQPGNTKVMRQYAAPMSSGISLSRGVNGGDDSDDDVPLIRPISIYLPKTLPSQESELQPVPEAAQAVVMAEPKYESPLTSAPGIIRVKDFKCKCVNNKHIQDLANQFCMTMTLFLNALPYKKTTNADYKKLQTEVTPIISKINEHIGDLINFDGGPISTELQYSSSSCGIEEYFKQERTKLSLQVYSCDGRHISLPLRKREYRIAFGVLAQFIPAAFSFIHPHEMTIEAVSRDLEYIDDSIADTDRTDEHFARNRLLRALVTHMALYYSYFLTTTDKRTFQTRAPSGVNSNSYANDFYTLLYNFLKDPKSLDLPLFKELIYILDIFYQQANSLKVTPETLESYY